MFENTCCWIIFQCLQSLETYKSHQKIILEIERSRDNRKTIEKELYTIGKEIDGRKINIKNNKKRTKDRQKELKLFRCIKVIRAQN